MEAAAPAAGGHTASFSHGPAAWPRSFWMAGGGLVFLGAAAVSRGRKLAVAWWRRLARADMVWRRSRASPRVVSAGTQVEGDRAPAHAPIARWALAGGAAAPRPPCYGLLCAREDSSCWTAEQVCPRCYVEGGGVPWAAR